MSFSRCATKSILLSFNLVLFLLGAAFIGVSVYVLGDSIKSKIIKSTAFQASVAISVFVMLLSIIGARGTMKNHRKSLRVYIFAIALLFLGSVVLGAFVTSYALDVSDLASNGDGQVLTGITNIPARDKLLKFIFDGYSEIYTSGNCIKGGLGIVPPPNTYDPDVTSTWTIVECQKTGVQKLFRRVSRIPTVDEYTSWISCMDHYTADYSNQLEGLWCRSNREIVTDVDVIANAALIVVWILSAILLIILTSSFVLGRLNKKGPVVSTVGV